LFIGINSLTKFSDEGYDLINPEAFLGNIEEPTASWHEVVECGEIK